jgi:quercetin 2,3-dioxygenase
VRIDVRPGVSRFVTRTEQVESRHSFSFGPHYDPDNIGFALLAAHNDDVLHPGGGFPSHAHRGVDIVTWLVSGALRHLDDAGGVGLVRPGSAQLLSAGTGVRHSEHNDVDTVTRYVQMWIVSDDEKPSRYALASAPAGNGAFALIAAGDAEAPLHLRRTGARLFAGRFRAGERTPLPRAAFVHVYVVRGALLLADLPLLAGDAARITDPAEIAVSADADCEVLVWLMDADRWRPPH